MLKIDELEDVMMGFLHREFIAKGRKRLNSRELYEVDAVFEEHRAMVPIAVGELKRRKYLIVHDFENGTFCIGSIAPDGIRYIESKDEKEIKTIVYRYKLDKFEARIADGQQLLSEIDCLQKVIIGGIAKYDKDKLDVIGMKYNEWVKTICLQLSDFMNSLKEGEGDKFMLECKKPFPEGDMKELYQRKVNHVISILNPYVTLLKEEIPAEQHQELGKPKTPKVFISHSSKDSNFACSLVDLLRNIGVDVNHILCSSYAGCHIPLGEKILDFLREQFDEYNLVVIFIHSANYYNSPISLNEMGAAWVLRYKCFSFLMPGFQFEDMKAVVGRNEISIKVDDGSAKHLLNDFKHSILEIFNLEDVNINTWETDRDRFLEQWNNK